MGWFSRRREEEPAYDTPTLELSSGLQAGEVLGQQV